MNGCRPPYFALSALGFAVFLTTSAAQAATSSATTNGWFIFAGRVAGLNNSIFRTDAWIFNPDAVASATVTLTFREQGGVGSPIVSSPIVLAARETRFFPDLTFVSPVPAGDGKVGSLEWQSDRPVMAAARVYTTSATGTFGFFLPGIPTAESMPPKTSAADTVNVLQMYGASGSDLAFRTNLDVTNTSNVSVTIQVRVIDPVSSVVYGGTREFGVAARSLVRLGQILATVGAPPIDGLRITVAIKEGTSLPGGVGGILAVATTLDNRTNDAFAFVGQRQSDTVVPAGLLPLSALP